MACSCPMAEMMVIINYGVGRRGRRRRAAATASEGRRAKGDGRRRARYGDVGQLFVPFIHPTAAAAATSASLKLTSCPSSKAAWIWSPMSPSGTLTSSLGVPSTSIMLRNPSSSVGCAAPRQARSAIEPQSLRSALAPEPPAAWMWKLTVDELVLLAGDVGDIDVVGRGGKLLVLLVGEDLPARASRGEGQRRSRLGAAG